MCALDADEVVAAAVETLGWRPRKSVTRVPRRRINLAVDELVHLGLLRSVTVRIADLGWVFAQLEGAIATRRMVRDGLLAGDQDTIAARPSSCGPSCGSLTRAPDAVLEHDLLSRPALHECSHSRLLRSAWTGFPC